MSGQVGGGVALEEWKLRLTSAKVEVKVEAEPGNTYKIMIPLLTFKKGQLCRKVHSL